MSVAQFGPLINIGAFILSINYNWVRRLLGPPQWPGRGRRLIRGPAGRKRIWRALRNPGIR